VVLSAACSGSGLYASDVIQKAGFELWAVSGLITNSPLFSQEFAVRSRVPVASSRAKAKKLANLIVKRITAVKRITSEAKDGLGAMAESRP
jgi:hypothetical protein